jgi:hypothetical protein
MYQLTLNEPYILWKVEARELGNIYEVWFAPFCNQVIQMLVLRNDIQVQSQL